MSPTSVQGLPEAQSRKREISERWAVVFKHTDSSSADPMTREEVISIETREPNSGPPSLAGLRSSPHRDRYTVERVPPDVKIGMVRGGKLNECASFGWESKFVRDSAGYSSEERRLPVGGAMQSVGLDNATSDDMPITASAQPDGFASMHQPATDHCQGYRKDQRGRAHSHGGSLEFFIAHKNNIRRFAVGHNAGSVVAYSIHRTIRSKRVQRTKAPTPIRTPIIRSSSMNHDSTGCMFR